MNRGTKFEDRASSSQGKHEGESSAHLCDRLCRTRDSSQRQLPTDQDYAVSTREYQTDQSSPKPAPAVACPVFDKRKKQRQRQNQPHRLPGIDRLLHIRCCSGHNAQNPLAGTSVIGDISPALRSKAVDLPVSRFILISVNCDQPYPSGGHNIAVETPCNGRGTCTDLRLEAPQSLTY